VRFRRPGRPRPSARHRNQPRCLRVHGSHRDAGEIVFHVYDFVTARDAAWKSDEVDIVLLGLPQAKRLPEFTSGGGEKSPHVDTGPAVQFIGVPAGASGRFANPRVGAVLSLALDRHSLAASVFGGFAEPAGGFLSPSALGRSLFHADACAPKKGSLPTGRAVSFPIAGIDLAPPSPDPTGIQTLLVRVGVNLAGQPLPLTFPNEGRDPALARSIAATWRPTLGGMVTLVSTVWKYYLAMAAGTQGFGGSFLEGWSPAYPGPEQHVGPLFTMAGLRTGNWYHLAFPNDSGRTVRDQDDPGELTVPSAQSNASCAPTCRYPAGLRTGRRPRSTPPSSAPQGQLAPSLDRARSPLRELYRKDFR